MFIHIPDGYIFGLLIMGTPKGQWSPFDANFMDWNLIGPDHWIAHAHGRAQERQKNLPRANKMLCPNCFATDQLTKTNKNVVTGADLMGICFWRGLGWSSHSFRGLFCCVAAQEAGWGLGNAAIAAAVLLVRAINCWLHSAAEGRGQGPRARGQRDVSDAEIA